MLREALRSGRATRVNGEPPRAERTTAQAQMTVRSPILWTDTSGEQAMTYRVVVLGGFGHFGARIVRALAATTQVHVIAAGRHPGDAATKWPGSAPGSISTCRLDIDASDFAAQLAATGADAVVHTAGPFQGQDYAVAQCCLQAGMHYIDLADGRAFVRDFPAAMGAAARHAQRVAISGASTLPALSSAVIDALSPRFSALHEIRMVIAPAQGTPLGLATVRAVLSYCGTPFSWWQAGRWQQVVGWAQPRAFTSHSLPHAWPRPAMYPITTCCRSAIPACRPWNFVRRWKCRFCSAVWRSLLGCANVVCRCRCSAWLMYLPKQDAGSIVSGPTWAACAWSCVAPAIPQRGQANRCCCTGTSLQRCCTARKSPVSRPFY